MTVLSSTSNVNLTINNCIGIQAVELCLVVRIVRRTLFTFTVDSKYVVRAEPFVCAIRIRYRLIIITSSVFWWRITENWAIDGELRRRAAPLFFCPSWLIVADKKGNRLTGPCLGGTLFQNVAQAVMPGSIPHSFRCICEAPETHLQMTNCSETAGSTDYRSLALQSDGLV